MLKTSAFKSLYSDQFTLSTQLMKPMQHHSFFRNLLPPLPWVHVPQVFSCLCGRNTLDQPKVDMVTNKGALHVGYLTFCSIPACDWSFWHNFYYNGVQVIFAGAEM